MLIDLSSSDTTKRIESAIPPELWMIVAEYSVHTLRSYFTKEALHFMRAWRNDTLSHLDHPVPKIIRVLKTVCDADDSVCIQD